MSPHEVLGVPAGASRDEVAAAFRRYALRHHPDRGGDAATFQAGLDAYRRLTGAAPPASADVVFHRRPRRGVPALLALLGRHRRPARSLA
jgi:curved DNA-binding protein CbpA